MRGNIVALGVIVLIIGVIPISGLAIPYVSSGLTSGFGYLGSASIVAYVVSAIGVILIILGFLAPKMGKWFHYY